MRKLGVIGGMSWLSTRAYYERINRLVQKQAPPMASPPMVIESLDYADLHGPKEAEDWQRVGGILAESARRLEGAGAEGLVIAANAMHKVYDEVAGAVSIPVLHIADAVGDQMERDRCRSAALLGTRYVMTGNFYRKRLIARGVELVPPEPAEVELVDGIIYKELMLGHVTRGAERALKSLITAKEKAGAKAIVVACAELEMVVDTKANVLPVYDSTEIHCREAARFILEAQ